MSNNLSVKVTADVADLNSNFLIAQARANALATELRVLAKATGGIADPAGIAGMQQLSGNLIAARQKVEGIHKLSEAITEVGQRANEIRSMSEVLGVTATQFQAMQVAAEEAGIGAEQMFRAEEKLVNILNEARDGSGAAIEKLKELGISNEQIRDKGFDGAQMIAFLSGRLNDSSTATAEMAAMLRTLGSRAAIAAEGIKQLGSDTGEWNAKAAEANALSDGQLKRLHEMGASWGILGKQIENAGAKILIWSVDSAKAVLAGTLLAEMGGALKDSLTPTAETGSGQSVSGKIDRSGAAAAD